LLPKGAIQALKPGKAEQIQILITWMCASKKGVLVLRCAAAQNQHALFRSAHQIEKLTKRLKRTIDLDCRKIVLLHEEGYFYE
jgi:hypothetical protein